MKTTGYLSEIDGYVLAGGASRRMGTDKAFLSLGGKTMVRRAADALFAISKEVRVVGNVLKDLPDLTVVPDITEHAAGRGAIVGLLTALRNARHDLVAVLACDLPFVTGDLMGRLAAIALETPWASCVIPRQSDGRLQPLCAIFRRDRCIELVDSVYQDRDWRMQHLIKRMDARIIDFDEVLDLPGSTNFFFNVNSFDDFERAAKQFASSL